MSATARRARRRGPPRTDPGCADLERSRSLTNRSPGAPYQHRTARSRPTRCLLDDCTVHREHHQRSGRCARDPHAQRPERRDRPSESSRVGTAGRAHADLHPHNLIEAVMAGRATSPGARSAASRHSSCRNDGAPNRAMLTASCAGFARRAGPACHCAAVARDANPPLRVATAGRGAGAHDRVGGHQPLDSAARRGLAAAGQLTPHPPRPVGLVVLAVDGAGACRQSLTLGRGRWVVSVCRRLLALVGCRCGCFLGWGGVGGCLGGSVMWRWDVGCGGRGVSRVVVCVGCRVAAVGCGDPGSCECS
jgi:hypothetical protein